jgi:hypothetical protein
MFMAQEPTKPMRALSLIQDGHGFIRAGELFYPGHFHGQQIHPDGRNEQVPMDRFADPAIVRARLLKSLQACDVYGA